MKKDLNWFKEQLDDIEMNTPRLSSHDSIWMLDRVNELLNQLDEPEVLTEELIYEKAIDTHVDTANGDIQVTFILDDLQNLLVSKQELPVVPTWFDEWWKDVTKGGGNLFHNIERFYDELFSSGAIEMFGYIGSPSNKKKLLNIIINELDYVVEKEQKYYVLDKEGATLLRKSAAGEGVAPSVGANIYNVKRWENEGKYRLTEREIKDYDERYIPFMVPVEELEE